MTIELRAEISSDYEETEGVVREAFWNLYRPGADAHYVLHKMRQWREFVPELDYVALDGDRIVGSIAYHRAYVLGDDEQRREVLVLGPLAVLPEYQRRGLGRLLINHTRELARSMGFGAIFLRGNPEYYTRRGFEAAEKFGVRTRGNMYASALQVCELVSGSVRPGRLFESEIDDYDAEKLRDYDARFPPRDRLFDTVSQRRYWELVSKRRPADLRS